MQDLIEAVKAHALANYESGWSVIVECYDDEMIEAILVEDKATTVAEALAPFAVIADVWHDREMDAINSAF